MKDLTDVTLVSEPEVVAPEDYIPPYNQTSPDPVDKGTYTGHFVDGAFKIDGDRKPIRFGVITSSKNHKTYRSVEIVFNLPEAKIAGKDITNKRVYGRFNTMPESLIFSSVKKGRENANGWMDALRAAGFTGPLVTNDDYENATLDLIERGVEVRLRIDKEAYSNPKSTEYVGNGATIRGEASFTGIPDGQGGMKDVGLRVVCPGDYANEADRPILLAKNVIKAVYPASKR